MKNTAISKGKLTPLMEQYWTVKSAHPDKILFFRMGDFFELFDQDAILAAPILGIALTVRNKKSGDNTKMCGMPHHSVAGPINKLLSSGYKVAICDQLEDPKQAKGLVKRGVTRILSPGMVFDTDMLDSQVSNYLACLTEDSLAFLEASTGEAFYYETKNETEKQQLLDILGVSELVLSESQKEKVLNEKKSVGGPHLTGFESSKERLELFHKRERYANEWKGLPSAVLLLLEYVFYMQDESLFETIRHFQKRETKKFLELGVLGVRHLELFENSRGGKEGSLYQSIHRCKSSIGSRLLRSWMSFPLQSQTEIQKRQERVQFWIAKHNTSMEGNLTELRAHLAELGDPERRLSKVAGPGCSPRDMRSLMESLMAGLQLCYLAKDHRYDSESILAVDDIIKDIENTIVDEAPISTSKGSYIKEGVHDVLDEYISLSTNAQQLLREMEQREKEAHQIPSLKIRYNNVFGFYIEITNTHKAKVPNHYMRKQTLANSERYTTDELHNLEKKILSANAKREDLELEIFNALKHKIVANSSRILSLVDQWAELDVLTSFAYLAIERSYTKPEFSEDSSLQLVGSKHPVVEIQLGESFVANDLHMKKGECFLITGPNMAGKSTLMRQVALLSIMAQMGCYVPAKAAKLPLLDRIFTRIGASDYLAEGQSTFMVEMLEAAEILKDATSKSLILLDEVGRGTSTYDGLSLAQAILEHILQKVGALCLFATHYHELNALEQDFHNLSNYHMAISDHDKEIHFLHLLKKGPANRSFGIHVAKLAGLPNTVVKRAEKVLKDLELSNNGQMSLMAFAEGQLVAEHECPKAESLKDEALQELVDQLKEIKIQEMTPLDAMNRIAQWQKTFS